MGARRHGPDAASFLQQDMYAGALSNLGLALDPLSQNRYALAGGNPISYIETDGHMVLADGGGGGSASPTPEGDSGWDQFLEEAKGLGHHLYGHGARALNAAVLGGLLETHVSILRKQAEALLDESKLSAARYVEEGRAGARGMALHAESYQKYLESEAWTRRAGSTASRFGAKIPIFSGGLDWAYDQLPTDVTDSIEGGLDHVGNAIGDTGGAIKDAWNSIF
jgi:hypothetical protein